MWSANYAKLVVPIFLLAGVVTVHVAAMVLSCGGPGTVQATAVTGVGNRPGLEGNSDYEEKANAKEQIVGPQPIRVFGLELVVVRRCPCAGGIQTKTGSGGHTATRLD